MIKQLEVLMYEERLKELHVCRLAEEPREYAHVCGWGPDSCLVDNWKYKPWGRRGIGEVVFRGLSKGNEWTEEKGEKWLHWGKLSNGWDLEARKIFHEGWNSHSLSHLEEACKGWKCTILPCGGTGLVVKWPILCLDVYSSIRGWIHW